MQHHESASQAALGFIYYLAHYGVQSCSIVLAMLFYFTHSLCLILVQLTATFIFK